jgi:nicotinate-nucleotide adenylyltransferase
MPHIALFGTSADPPSVAHREILRWLCDRYDCVAVWASDNPMKSQQTPLDHRTAMLKLMVEELRQPHPDLDGSGCDNIAFHAELSCSRTLFSVEKARKIWPHAQLTLVVGSDLLTQLPRWYRVTELLKQVQLLVIPRPGSPVELEKLEQLQVLGGTVTVANMNAPDVSSTFYRKTQNSQAIPPSVEAYIQREQLYV